MTAKIAIDGAISTPLTASIVHNGVVFPSVKAPQLGVPPQITIVMERGIEQVAPEAVAFKVVIDGVGIFPAVAPVTFDRRQSDVDYEWDFGRAGAKWQAPLAAGRLDALQMNDPNKGFGRHPVAVFGPGSHTITVTMRLPGTNLVATDTVTIVVADPAVAYAGSKTIVVAKSGNFTGAPTGASQHTTLAAAIAAYKAMTTKGRMLLKGGETYESFGNVSAGFPNLDVSSWGTGRAIIDCTSATGISAGQASSTEIKAHKLHFQGGWNDELETGGLQTHNGISVRKLGDLTVHDCVFDGLMDGVAFGIDPYGSTDRRPKICISDTTIRNWANFAIYGNPDGSQVGLIGLSLVQSPLSRAGGKAKFVPPANNMHGPIRLSRAAGHVYYDGIDSFAKTTWFANMITQPCIRHNTDGQPGAFSHIIRCVLEGGFTSVNVEYKLGGYPQNMVAERSYIFGHAQNYKQLVEGRMGGITFRNNIVVMPNCIVENYPTPYEDFLLFFHDTGKPGNKEAPVFVYGNTLVSHVAQSNLSQGLQRVSRVITGTTAFDTLVEDNNIVMQVGGPQDNQSAGPLDMNVLFLPRYTSYQAFDKTIPDTSYASSLDALCDYEPLAGSPMIGAAKTGMVPFRDFYGNIRSTVLAGLTRNTPSKGAIEPAIEA